MSKKGVEFKRINFGLGSAESEKDEGAELLLNGYYTPSGLNSDIVDSSKFIILGYKGCGKTAAAEHIRLTSQNDPNSFVEVVSLDDFPYSQVGEIVPMDAGGSFADAWKMLLLIRVFSSFWRDQGAVDMSPDPAQTMFLALQDQNLLITPSFKELVLSAKSGGLKGVIGSVLTLSGEQTWRASDHPIPFFTERLMLAAKSIRSSSRHMLLIDGLDQVLSVDSPQLSALASLVNVVRAVNSQMREHAVPFKIVVLCRTELWKRLPDPNKNKLKQAFARELIWYDDPRAPEQSELIRLAQRRVEASLPDATDFIAYFFPSYIQTRPTWMFLLDKTRHTPRDFLTLLRKIQDASRGSEPSEASVLTGARNYSTEYFVDEIRDELRGYIPDGQIEAVFDSLGQLQGREFTTSSLKSILLEKSDWLSVEELLKVLYDCSAIGNVHYEEGKKTYYSYRYRNPNVTANLKQPFQLHPGLWKALNLA
jgi:hypothetical protein